MPGLFQNMFCPPVSSLLLLCLGVICHIYIQLIIKYVVQTEKKRKKNSPWPKFKDTGMLKKWVTGSVRHKQYIILNVLVFMAWDGCLISCILYLSHLPTCMECLGAVFVHHSTYPPQLFWPTGCCNPSWETLVTRNECILPEYQKQKRMKTKGR